MTKIIAIANQKGGVGKTTTAVNLATTLAVIGKRVLLVDVDSQGNASTGLGFDANERETTTYEVFSDSLSMTEVLRPVLNIDNLFIAPASVDLSSIDTELVNDRSRVLKLKHSLTEISDDFDYIFIDCPPSLNLLTLNALAATNSVLVPLQAEFFALEGLSQLMTTIKEVRSGLNPQLAIQGIVLTMYDSRNKLASQVEDDVRENLGEVVYKTVIPRNVRLSEAPSYALPALLYDPKSSGSRAYQKLAAEFLEREKDTV